ncbi:MAG: CRTAC1 family protein [Pyrinomonadaceae bacterium]
MTRIVSTTTLLFIACQAVAAQYAGPMFADGSAASGMTVKHVSTPENRYIIESISGGAAVFDCDGDDYLDAAVVVGSSVERFKKGGDPFITLYKQVNGATSKSPVFEDVTVASGLSRKGWGMAVTAADIDNDKILDLFATGFEGNAVYKGLGNCRFADVTERSGLKGRGFMSGAAWADFDRDGDLDVFVPGYVILDLNNLPAFGSSPTCSFRGIRVQCGPRGLPPEKDLLYRNRGNGAFEEISQKAGVSDEKRYYGLGAIWADYDNDEWLDLYVANDETPNYLYKNQRNGTFADLTFESGTGYSGTGDEQGSMGVTFGDYDNDGLLDLFVTNFDKEPNALYKNLGAKGFLDVSLQSKVGAPSIPYVGWGTGFYDLDNDGLLDLLVVNGHVYPQVDFIKGDSQLGFAQDYLLHRNLGNGTFEEISTQAHLREITPKSARGLAFGDLNNDGRIDAIVNNVGEVPTVLINTTSNKNKSLTLKVVQAGSNQFSIGARAILKTDKRSMIRNVEAGASYLSQNDLRLHFGVPEEEKVESLTVRWDDGVIEQIRGAEFGKILTIRKGSGIVSRQDYLKSGP